MKARKAFLPLLLAPLANGASFLSPAKPKTPFMPVKTRQRHQRPLELNALSLFPHVNQFFEPIQSNLVEPLGSLDQLLRQGSWLDVLSRVFVMGATTSEAWSSNMPLAAQIQATGETSLAALLVIAAIQGVLIVKQYESNPLGELVVPPGLTHGIEDATRHSDDGDLKGPPTCPPQLSSSELESMVCNSDDSYVCCEAKKGFYHVNRFLVLLLPLLTAQWSLAMLEFGHIFHMTCILGLAHIYDFFKKLPEMATEDEPTVTPAFGEDPHIVVIGDSMSVGIGVVNEFDPDKNSGIQYRIEHTEPAPGENPQKLSCGPVFPRALARTLSKRLGKPVSWRSGGVDGGDTEAIMKHLLPIIQEEVDKGKAPDVVVVLTGSNDLKQILSNGASVRGFRSNLMQLAKEIQTISPRTRVVFPALPTYRLDNNSILNVFPLSFFLDGIIAFWDAQKIEAAKKSPGVHYVDLTVQEVTSWYQHERKESGKHATLIAADGIHPNAACYAKWAGYVGNNLADKFLVEGPCTSSNEQTSTTLLTKAPAWGVHS